METFTSDDLCTALKTALRTKQRALGLSNQALADLSGLPLNTVSNFFSARAKSPSAYTAGALCKALGVSFNRIFDIRADEEEPTRREHELELENARQSGEIDRLNAVQEIQAAQTATKNITHLVLVGLCLMLTVALAAYIFFDAGDHSHGYIINGRPTLVAVIMLGVLAISIGVIVWAVLRYLLRR